MPRFLCACLLSFIVQLYNLLLPTSYLNDLEKASNIRAAPPLKDTEISIIIETAFKEGADRIKRKGDEENEQTDDGFDHHGRFRHQSQS